MSKSGDWKDERPWWTRFYPSMVRPTLPWEGRRAPDTYGATATPDWREVDWPAHLHRIEVAGREMAYVDIGEGDESPVVFIHGLGGNWQSFLENIPRVAQERRAIATDLPGFGVSEMPADRISMSSYGRWVQDLLEQIGVERAVVVGNSMGGFIAAEMAVSYAPLVERLLLVGPAGISSTQIHRRPLVTGARAVTGVATWAASQSHAIVSRPRLRHLAFSLVVRHPSRLRPDLLHEIMAGTGAPGFVSALDALLFYDFSDRLPEIQCPTLLVWGAGDCLVPVEDADEYERLIPNAHKVVFDDTGHMPMAERPLEFNELLMRFLDTQAEGQEDPRAVVEPVTR